MFIYTAFEQNQILTQGSLETLALAVKRRLKENPEAGILIFSDTSGKQIDINLNGREKDVLERLKVFAAQDTGTTSAPQGPGRPKLGVVSREVSLLPQQWEWLSTQEGGASATLRRLVDEKMKTPATEKQRIQQAQEVAYRFMSVMAGDLPHYEEALRFMYRRDQKKFESLIAEWPKDIHRHITKLTKSIF